MDHDHFPIKKTEGRVELEICDLACADCAAKVEKSLLAIPGVHQASMNVLTGRMTAHIDPARIDPQQLMDAVKSHGYDSHDVTNTARKMKKTQEPTLKKYRLPFLTGASGIFWIGATALAWVGHFETAAKALYLVGIAFALAGLGREIWASFRNLRFDMNILMTAAVAGAIFLGEWAEGAMVLFLFALAELIESYSLSRANRAIESLMDLAPDQIRLVKDFNESMVSPEEVPVGSFIIVKPGERIGLDGAVTAGQSQVNQAPVTGESAPVVRQPGDEVFAGTINGEGALTIRTTRPASDSTVARIIRLVQESQAAKAPSQRFVDSFARVYTPIVFAVAIAVTAIPVLALGLPFADWFYRSLVILLIACPCAFVIATPVTIVSGLAAAARSGVLIKGGMGMEKAAKIKAFAFDKTGTVTVGKPVVKKVVALDGLSPCTLLEYAAAVEKDSGHVLGRAIAEYAEQQNCRIPAAEGVKIMPGLGAVGLVDGQEVFVGSHRFFHEKELCNHALHETAAGLEGLAHILVFVGAKASPRGIVVLSDVVRDRAKASIEALRTLGIGHVALLSGDNKAMVESIGSQIGVDEARAELMPEQKVEALKEIRKAYGPVAMVGDGINDAPALAASDLGIAMGAGTDQALETADAALISENLEKLPTLIALARKTMTRVKANIAIALGLKFAFLILAVLGLATLWMAVFADMGASLIVIANGVRLLRSKQNESSSLREPVDG